MLKPPGWGCISGRAAYTIAPLGESSHALTASSHDKGASNVVRHVSACSRPNLTPTLKGGPLEFCYGFLNIIHWEPEFGRLDFITSDELEN